MSMSPARRPREERVRPREDLNTSSRRHQRSSTAEPPWSSLVAADERSTLLVERHLVATACDLEAKRNDGLADEDRGEDSERERAPVDERVVRLVGKRRPEVPGDGDAGGEVTLGRGEGVGRSCGLEEEEAEEDEDLGPDAGVVVVQVDTEGGESGEHDKDGRPAVVERERQVHEELVRDARWLVVLLDDVIDMRHQGGDEEREDEGCVTRVCEMDCCGCGSRNDDVPTM